MVRRPAIYELHGEKSLADILELAGGMLPDGHPAPHRSAAAGCAREAHDVEPGHSPTTGRRAMTLQLAAFEIHDGDRIRIFPIAPYNQDAIYLRAMCFDPAAIPIARA